MNPTDKNSSNDQKVVINPGNIAEKLESLVLGRDLRNLINLTGDLEISYGAGGLKEFMIRGKDGKTVVANMTHILALGGARRFVAGVIKQAEGESADAHKMFLIKEAIKQLKTNGTAVPKKVRQDAMRRLSEIIRSVKNIIENMKIARETWSDSGTDEKYFRYFEGLVGETGLALNDEVLSCFTREWNPDNIQDKLLERKVPSWFYEKIVQKGATYNTEEAFDFFFPKRDGMGGVTFLQCEINDDDFLVANAVIAENNHDFLVMARTFQVPQLQSVNRDTVAIVQMRYNCAKWNMVPDLSPVDMIERFDNAKFSEEEMSIPDGDAGLALRELLPEMAKANLAWNRYKRYAVFSPTEREQFWVDRVKGDTIRNLGVLTTSQFKQEVRELKDSDFHSESTPEYSAQILTYCAVVVGYHTPTTIFEFIERNSLYDVFSTDERVQLISDHKEKYRNSVDDHNNWLKSATDFEAEITRASNNEDKEKLTSDYSTWKNENPEPFIPKRNLEWEEVPILSKSEHAPRPKKRGDKELMEDLHFHIEFPKDFYYLDEDNPPRIPDGDKKMIEALMTKAPVQLRSDNAPIGIMMPLSTETTHLLNELDKNIAYGKILKEKISNWLRSSLTGAPELHNIAVQSILLGLRSQAFYNETEEEGT